MKTGYIIGYFLIFVGNAILTYLTSWQVALAVLLIVFGWRVVEIASHD